MRVKYVNYKDVILTAPEHIRKEFIRRKHKKGSLIIHPHEKNDFLYILTEGIVEVHSQEYTGATITLYINETYSCFGELEIFNENIETLGIIAKQPCETIAIHKSKVYEWMKEDFRFNLYLVKQLTAKLIYQTAAVRFSKLKVNDRVLFSILNHYKTGNLHRLTKRTLSNETGVPIRSLNRSIAQCREEGFIEYKNKTFSILSLENIQAHFEHFFLS